MALRFLVITCLAWSGLVTGCGDGVGWEGGLVGGSCRDSYDCARESYCERGGDYPGGTCTLQCRDHYDCPRHTACVDRKGGICLLECLDSRDCRPGYSCKYRRDRRGPRDSRVCIR